MGKTNLVRRISSLVIILSLIFQQTGFAQMAAQMDLSGYLGGLKNSSVKDIYRPAHLRYFSYDNLTDNFKLLVEKGDSLKSIGTGRDLSVINAGGQDNKIKQEARELLKYFLTGVSLQDDIFWVNLRPDSQDQIIDNWLEKTDVGRIMLEADLQLKKDTAMFTSPETTLGRKYWDKLYKKAAELYGYDNVTIPTLTRPWIVPGEIIIRETRDEGRKTTPSAYIYKATLKVMLEEDYIKTVGTGHDLSVNYEFKDPRAKELNKYSTQLIRELIIPKLTKEVNSSKRYAALRQVYYSLILSRWFKMRFSGKQGTYSSLINSSNLNNLTSQEPWSKNTYFKQYQKSFSEGEYNIKEPVSTPTGQVIRSYFSGGIQIGPENTFMNVLPSGNNMIYEVSAAMPGIVPIQGLANLNLADLRILPMGKAANREITTLRASKKSSSGISFAAVKKETFVLLKDMRVMTVEELDAKDMVGSYSAKDVLDDLARTHWTVKKEGKSYFYRPFRLFSQANEKTNLRLLKLLGADGILGGHSEVRKNRKMDNKAVNNLLHQAFQVFGADSRHIMAMGEPLEMRDSQGNLTEEGWEFLDAQVKEGFAGLTSEQIQKIIVGYEPIWSIGTGVTAKPEQAQEVHAAIRAKLPIDIRDDVIIQYGGSMKPDNAAGLMVKVDVGGGLIGGVSLKKESALALINTILNTVREQKKAGTYTGRVPAIVFNLKADFMDNSYIVELMNIFKFIQDNLSDVDFENIHIGFAVADTDIPLFNRALKGENPQDLVDLSKASLPNKLELAVNIDSVSAFEPGAYTSEITAEALRRAGVKAVIADYSIPDTDPRVVRAEAAGLRRVKLNNMSHIVDVFSFKNQIKNGFKGQVIVIEPALAREAYVIANELQAENAGPATGVSSAVKISEDLTKKKIDQEIAKMEQKLVDDQFEQMINGAFGKKKDEVNSKIAQIGFDGKANRLGWTTASFDWIFSHPETVDQVLTDAQNIRDNYDNVVFCGMGGSGLSVEAVKTTYGDKKIHIYSLRTTDPATIAHILEDEIASRYIQQGKKDVKTALKKAMSKTLFVVISKSWKTPETLKHFEYLNQLYSQLELNFNNNVWAVTDKSSPGDTGKYTQRDIQLNGEGDIVGRFTAPTTNVFLLPLALVANEKVWRILERARDMHKAGDMTGGQFVKLAAFLCYNAEKLGRNKLTFIVPEEFRAIPFWSEQLFEESLGKDGKGVTMFYGETLSPKMLKPVENEDRVFVRIDLKGKNTQGEFWKYLQDKGYAAFDIAVEDKDDIGGVMLGLQRTVAGIAYLWDINFVNQPAVEDYKTATNEILGKLKPGEKVTVPADWTNSVFYKDLTFYIDTLYQANVITSGELQSELQILDAQQTDAAAVFAAIMRVLLKKHANFEAMLLAPYGMTTPALKKSLERIREKIFTNKLKIPTKIAEGPDYNHSFQQNVAAGTDIFFSLLGMVNNPRQPQVLAFGDNLIKAQVLGTVESITAAGRKAMLWTTGATMDETAVQLGEFFNEVGNYLDVGTTSATASSSIEAKFEQKFSERLKQGDKAVVKEIKQYYSGLGVDDQQIAYEYLQAHESALAADALSAVGLPWNGVVKALVAKIKGEKEGNHRASARQLKELATKGTCAGLTPPTQEIVSEAQRVWSENPQFNRLIGRVIFPEFPVLQVDKPGKLVLIRHGETDWSEAVLNKWAGWYDAHVTQNGLKGAFNAGLSLKDIKFDKAYTSDLSRAKDTLLQILFATAQTDVEQIVSAELRERDYGTGGMIGWRRSEVEEVFGKDILKNWRRGYDTDEARPFGGENLLDVQERSVPYFIENIMVDIARGKTVIISAHGNSLRAILIELRRYTNNAQVPEAEIIKLEVPLSEPIVVGFDKELRVNNAQGPKLIIQFLGSSTPQNQTGSVSSSLQAMPENAGAIDFRGRAMNINYEAMGSFKGLDLKLPRLSSIELNKINIDSEIQQIKKMVSSGISPSGRRIIELAAACEQKGKMSVYAKDLLFCVVGACELAEVNAEDNSPDFNKALMFIDSRS